MMLVTTFNIAHVEQSSSPPASRSGAAPAGVLIGINLALRPASIGCARWRPLHKRWWPAEARKSTPHPSHPGPSRQKLGQSLRRILAPVARVEPWVTATTTPELARRQRQHRTNNGPAVRESEDLIRRGPRLGAIHPPGPRSPSPHGMAPTKEAPVRPEVSPGLFRRDDRIRTCDPLTPRRPKTSIRPVFRVIPRGRSCRARHGMHGLHESGPLLVPSHVERL